MIKDELDSRVYLFFVILLVLFSISEGVSAQSLDKGNITKINGNLYTIDNPFNYKVIYLNDTYVLVEPKVYEEIEIEEKISVSIRLKNNCSDIPIPYAGITNLHILRPDLAEERMDAVRKRDACYKNVSENFLLAMNLSEEDFNIEYDFGHSLSGYINKNALNQLSNSSLVYDVELTKYLGPAINGANESENSNEEIKKNESEFTDIKKEGFIKKNETDLSIEQDVVFGGKEAVNRNISNMIIRFLSKIKSLFGWLK